MDSERGEIYLWVLEQSHFRCEICAALNGERNTVTRKNTRVFVGHIDDNLDNLSRGNLQAICDVCYKVAVRGAVQMALM